MHGWVDVAHQLAHVGHDGGQLPQRNAQVLQDRHRVAVAQLFALGRVDLAKAVFLGHGVQDGVEPGHGVCQGSIEVEGGEVVFQESDPVPARRGATGRWGVADSARPAPALPAAARRRPRGARRSGIIQRRQPAEDRAGVVRRQRDHGLDGDGQALGAIGLGLEVPVVAATADAHGAAGLSVMPTSQSQRYSDSRWPASGRDR